MKNIKIIKRLTKTPIVRWILNLLAPYVANKKANRIASHFTSYFSPEIAKTQGLKESCYTLRHQIYCEEMAFLPKSNDGLETDECDKHSIHCLLKHIKLDLFAGTVRVVYTREADERLPFEIHCGDVITEPHLNPRQFPRGSICEVSRLAVPAGFRRRKTDVHDGSATGVINEHNYSESEVRCFPFIAIGLYLMAAATIKKNGLEHVFVMMEPRLARSMSFVGIKFTQIGPKTDYHGLRAPYYLNIHEMIDGLNSGFKGLYNRIESQLENNS